MKKTSKYLLLFDAGGCLTAQTIGRYIEKNLGSGEYSQIVSHIEICPLCKSAIEGTASFSKSKSFISNVSDLKKEWGMHHSRIITDYRALIGYSTVAASVLLLVGVMFIMQLQNQAHKKYLSNKMPVEMSLDSAIYYAENIIVPFKSDIKYKESKEDFLKRRLFIENFSVNLDEVTEARIVKARIISVSSKEEVERPSREKADFMTDRVEIKKIREISLNPDEDETVDYEDGNDNWAEEKTYTIVEQMPSFNNAGIEEFDKYIKKNIRYPLRAIELGISGRVYVQFAIDKRGKVSNPKILKSCHPLLDAEVIRVLYEAPPWKPGQQNNILVKVQMAMPVDFTIRK